MKGVCASIFIWNVSMIDSRGEPFCVTASRQIRIKYEKTVKNRFARSCKDRNIGQRYVDADRFFYYYIKNGSLEVFRVNSIRIQKSVDLGVHKESADNTVLPNTIKVILLKCVSFSDIII